MEISAEISVVIDDQSIIRALYSSLKPETVKAPTERSTTKITLEKNTITIKISTNDLTSLRASINSYFKWLKAILESLEVINDVWSRSK